MNIRIASLLALSAVLTTSAPAFAQGFGQSVAIHDGRVLVGESLIERGPGMVYLFEKNGSNWAETGRFSASDASDGDHFGRSIGATGNQVLVGATVRNESLGAVYVYTQDASGEWPETQVLTASDGAPGDAFGRGMVVDGDLALIATYAHGEGRGAVYAFRRDANGVWSEEAKLMASDAQEGDWFGTALALSGDLAVIGAAQRAENQGIAYAFRHDGMGGWSEVAQLEGTGIEANSRFGFSLWTDGEMIAAGAITHDQFKGAVYTFQPDGNGGFAEGPILRPFDGGTPGLIFGMSMAMVDGEAWIGAQGANGGQGGFYVLTADGQGSFSSARKVGVEDLPVQSGFGSAIESNGSLVVASAANQDYGLGSVRVLERVNGEWSQTGILVGDDAAGLEAITGDQVDCSEGSASIFGCDDMDIVSFTPTAELGGGRGVQVNDVWGWTDPESGKEIAIVGRYDGTTFMDVSNPSAPVVLGNLPLHEGANTNVWRDMKVYENHAYIVSDGAGAHGMQVFDLTRLRDFDGTRMELTEDAHYDQIASAHNIVINEETGFAYAVGASSGGETCGGGLHMIDIRTPDQPTFAGCFSDPSTGRSGTGYSHDAQCIVYRGPDSEHSGKEICFGSNETALSIADVSDKSAPVALASASYPNTGYTHQGWIDEQHEYFYVNDELDELQGKVDGTRTLVWDVRDLDDPLLVTEYFSGNKSSDHNLYIKGDLMYQSNYVSGLRVFDISDRENPTTAGFFDTVPWGDDAPGFDGSWSNYPYFESGIVIVTSGKEGVFVLKKKTRPVS